MAKDIIQDSSNNTITTFEVYCFIEQPKPAGETAGYTNTVGSLYGAYATKEDAKKAMIELLNKNKTIVCCQVKRLTEKAKQRYKQTPLAF